MEATKGSSRQRSGRFGSSVNIEIPVTCLIIYLETFSCQDLSSQNATLHQHLESVSTQATRIRQAADASVAQPAEGEEVVDDADSRLSELRSVVSYLRKEKGIVDLQLEMSKQENERLKAHIERLTQTLQETRTTLSDVRSLLIPNLWLKINYTGTRASYQQYRICSSAYGTG